MKKLGKILIYLGLILIVYAVLRFFPMYAGGYPWDIITYSVGNPIIFGGIAIISGYIFTRIKWKKF